MFAVQFCVPHGVYVPQVPVGKAKVASFQPQYSLRTTLALLVLYFLESHHLPGTSALELRLDRQVQGLGFEVTRPLDNSVLLAQTARSLGRFSS